MFVIFDSTSFDIIRFLFITKDQKKEYLVTAKNREMLEHFSLALSKENKSLDDITGIAVLVAKGSFTSTRIAVTIANTLHYAKKIPVMGVLDCNDVSFDDLDTKFKQSKDTYLHPIYSGEPNIN